MRSAEQTKGNNEFVFDGGDDAEHFLQQQEAITARRRARSGAAAMAALEVDVDGARAAKKQKQRKQTKLGRALSALTSKHIVEFDVDAWCAEMPRLAECVIELCISDILQYMPGTEQHVAAITWLCSDSRSECTYFWWAQVAGFGREAAEDLRERALNLMGLDWILDCEKLPTNYDVIRPPHIQKLVDVRQRVAAAKQISAAQEDATAVGEAHIEAAATTSIPKELHPEVGAVGSAVSCDLGIASRALAMSDMLRAAILEWEISPFSSPAKEPKFKAGPCQIPATSPRNEIERKATVEVLSGGRRTGNMHFSGASFLFMPEHVAKRPISGACGRSVESAGVFSQSNARSVDISLHKIRTASTTVYTPELARCWINGPPGFS